MESQTPHVSKGHQLQSIGFDPNVFQGRDSLDEYKKEDQQPDALTRLGKLPVLKVRLPLRLLRSPD